MTFTGGSDQDPYTSFPDRPLLITSKLESMETYTDKIANYSFVCTIIVSWAFSVLMAEIRSMQQNHNLCQSVSLLSVAINIIWNLLFFSMHFQYSLQGEYFQFLGMPAFWFFISTCTFNTKLFIIVWKAQLTVR